MASEILTRVWVQDSYIGDVVAQMPWVIDGVVPEEVKALQVLEEFTHTIPELSRGLVDSQWVADGLNEDEFERVDETLRHISWEDPELAILLVATPWAADGLDEAEWYAFEELLIMGRDHGELTRLLITSSWVADGAGLEEPSMGAMVFDLLEITSQDPETARLAATASWVVDGVSRGEARVISFVSHYLDRYPESSKSLLDYPQTVKDLIADDELLYNIVPIAFWDRPAALIVARYADSGTEEMLNHLTNSMTGIAEHDAALLTQLTEQSWFIDGLDGGEVALIATLDNVARKSSELYKDLLTSHHVQFKTVSLPLAGNVDIWVVQSDSPPPGENLIKSIEDTARITEGLIDIPFPVNEVILLVAPPGHGLIGEHRGTHMVLLRSGDRVESVPHETAHYYFTNDMGPLWLTEGTAEFIEAYVNHLTVVQRLSERRAELSRDYCFTDLGLENIRHYTYNRDQTNPVVADRCAYALGENFMLGLYETFNRDAFAAALRDLHDSELGRQYSENPPGLEEAVYLKLMEHAPPEKEEAFLDLYRSLHGGVFAFPEIDFSDEHGDEPWTATEVEMGKVIHGALDYMFDFDYFRFKAEGGGRYRIRVSHPTLGASSVMLFSPDGVTQELGKWKSRRLEPSGPQILWVAPISEDYYFAVQNFGGETGPYTLRIDTFPDYQDDHPDTIADATYVSLGEVAKGFVEGDYDYDYFRFRVVAGRQYQIKVTGESLWGWRVRLYTADGDAPEGWDNRFDDNSVSGEITKWTAPGTGEYYLALEGFQNSSGAYILTITWIEPV